MSGMGEERCRDLLSKLARGCGWHVRSWTLENDGFVRKQVQSKNRFLTWDGKTWTDVWRQLLRDLEYFRTGPIVVSDPPVQWFADALPAWVAGCGSEEELVLRAEAML